MLGSPRVVSDQTGNIVSRRDFMPFGEELTRANYGSDSIRQKFTGYEKDTETGLDFAEARYYNSAHGRFTAVDPLLASGKSADPQTFNRYIYTMNNPLVMTDPTGMQAGTDENEVLFVQQISAFTQWIRESLEARTDYLLSGITNADTSQPQNPFRSNLNTYINPTTGPAINEFNEGMQKIDSVLQYEPTGVYNVQKSATELDRGNGSYGKFAIDTGMMVGSMLTLPSGGSANSKVLKEGGEETFNLAVGIVNRNQNLFKFARETNSTTYFEAVGSGFTEPAFIRLANRAKEINVNLGNGFSISDYYKWQKAGQPDVADVITNVELDIILSNKEFLKKTNFFVYPPLKK